MSNWFVIAVAFLGLCVAPAMRAQVNEPEAESAIRNYAGLPVADVIDRFRQQGYPIAYSSQLVPATLVVKSEPYQTEPLEIVGEILKPHGLVLKRADGIYLVVRDQSKITPSGRGSLLLIVRDETAKPLAEPVTIRGSPSLTKAERLGEVIYQFTGLSPGRYVLDIESFGYEPARRQVDIRASDVAVLHVRLELGLAELEQLTISASRYVLFSNSQFFIDQRAIENLPDIGDDPVRSAHRLPGAAAGGWSARSYFRGGEENETAIFLNGLQLVDPFHVRDYQNIFSSIDARSISGVEAYTGGFPAAYGNHMSGLLLLESQQPEEPRFTQLGLSVFNTSVLTSGYSEDGRVDWLFSGRLSNLQHVLDADLGKPKYNDIFATAGIQLSEDSSLYINALRADDSVLVVTESQLEEREQSDSDTRNENFWLSLENRWSSKLSSVTVASASRFSNNRKAFLRDPEQLVGDVRDERDVEIYALKQDWGWDISERHFLQWGFEARRLEADYRYTSEAEYFGFYLAYPDQPDSLERDITASYDGESYSLYVSDRFQLTSRTRAELGLRWDKQTYLGPIDDDQFSPRASLFHEIGERTELRLSWGRYHQSQGIQELQVEDGVSRFFPAQRSDHLIAGIQYRFPNRYRIRAEAYLKEYDDLRPRFENLQDSLALIPELEPDRARIAPESGKSRGFELTVESHGNDELDWWASYSLSRVTDSIEGRNEKRNWDQRHALQTGAAWHRGPWEIGLAVNIHSGWPTTTLSLVEQAESVQFDHEDDEDDELDIKLAFGPRNAAQFDTFASFDFRISREWLLPNSRLSAFFELSNAFNRHNECCIDYDIEDEDAEEIELETSIDHWLPILPAIGVLWEF